MKPMPASSRCFHPRCSTVNQVVALLVLCHRYDEVHQRANGDGDHDCDRATSLGSRLLMGHPQSGDDGRTTIGTSRWRARRTCRRRPSAAPATRADTGSKRESGALRRTPWREQPHPGTPPKRMPTAFHDDIPVIGTREPNEQYRRRAPHTTLTVDPSNVGEQRVITCKNTIDEGYVGKKAAVSGSDHAPTSESSSDSPARQSGGSTRRPRTRLQLGVRTLARCDRL